MLSWCGIGCQDLNHLIRPPDAARSPKLGEVRVQKPANPSRIGANLRLEKQELPPDNFRAVLASGTVAASCPDHYGLDHLASTTRSAQSGYGPVGADTVSSSHRTEIMRSWMT